MILSIWQSFRETSISWFRHYQHWLVNAAAFAWLAAIAHLSFLPAPLKGQLDTKGPLHFPAHFAVFGIATLILWSGFKPRRAFAGAVVGAYGFSIEWYQAWINGCPLEWDDVSADLAGVLVAAVFLDRIALRRKSSRAEA